MVNKIDPNFLFKKACKCFRKGTYRQAEKLFLQILDVSPNDIDVLHHLGTVCVVLKKWKEAEKHYKHLLKIKPDFYEAFEVLIFALIFQGKDEEALKFYKDGVGKNPENSKLLSDYFYALSQVCDWEKQEDIISKLDNFLVQEAQGRISEAPFAHLARDGREGVNYVVAKSRSHDVFTTVYGLKNRKEKITIGYFSSDFRNHAMAHLTADLYRLHDRYNFVVNCYSMGKNDGSYYRKKIENDCDNFVDIQKMNYIEASRRINEDGVDIMVDLKGYTGEHRIHISALRPVPIMVRWLGMAGTTASTFFDYIVTDKIVTPPESQKYYSENFAYMPHCYQINNRNQIISDKEYKRADFGLPEKGIVFCCFNQGYKIEPVMFDVWMKILKQVPDSILWLIDKRTMKKNLRMEAFKRGIDPDRLVFAEKLPKAEHLKRLQLADIALDTRIVNGAITTSDALWAGVPVITLQGRHFASRMSSSILQAARLPQLITHTLEEYEALAVKLGMSDEMITIDCSTTPLFDTESFVTNLEKAYKEMWKIYMAGERPRQIAVVESKVEEKEPEKELELELVG